MEDIVSAGLMISGSIFICIAALGVLRMPELFLRMHSTSKAGTLGIGLILLSVAVHFQQADVITRALATVIFMILTVPVSVHAIARAAYQAGVPLWKNTIINELRRY